MLAGPFLSNQEESMFKRPNQNYFPDLQTEANYQELMNQITELKKYLRKNLTVASDSVGNKYYSCGNNHALSYSPPGWDPFKNLKQFCDERNIYWKDFLFDIDQLGMRFHCECLLVNREIDKSNRRRRLQKIFGIDLNSHCRFE